jgi:hypothetical protein
MGRSFLLTKNVGMLTKRVIVFVLIAAVKVVLRKEHQLCCLAFPEIIVNCQWNRVLFSKESTFSSTSDRAGFSLQKVGRVLQLPVFVGQQGKVIRLF